LEVSVNALTTLAPLGGSPRGANREICGKHAMSSAHGHWHAGCNP